MSHFDAVQSTEFPDVVIACPGHVKALLDAITSVFDLGKGEINFCRDASDIKSPDI